MKRSDICNYFIYCWKCNVVQFDLPTFLSYNRGNAKLGKLVTVGLEKSKLFQSQNIQDEIINQSDYDDKISFNFIDQMRLGCLTSTPYTQLKHSSAQVSKIPFL